MSRLRPDEDDLGLMAARPLVKVVRFFGEDLVGFRFAYDDQLVGVFRWLARRRPPAARWDGLPVGPVAGTWWTGPHTANRVEQLLDRRGYPRRRVEVDVRPLTDPTTDVDPVLTAWRDRRAHQVDAPGLPLTWEAFEALGLDPTTGRRHP